MSCKTCGSNITFPTQASQTASGPVYISNTVFVSQKGSNTTGTVERLDLPYLTIAAAITAAITLSPSATKRVNVVIFGGLYNETISIANSYISIVSGYESEILFDIAGYSTVSGKYSGAKRPVYISGTITTTVDYTTVMGINCKTLAVNHTSSNSYFKSIVADTSITTDQTTISANFFDVHSPIFLSLGSTATLSGYLEKCTGGTTSFAGNSSAAAGSISAKMTDCVATGTSYASSSAANAGSITSAATLTKCRATATISFGSTTGAFTAGTLAGAFIDCTSSSTIAFGSGNSQSTIGTLSGLFIRCGDYTSTMTSNFHFGSGKSGGNLSGTFLNCRANDFSYGYGTTAGSTLSGNFKYCTGNDYVFGATDNNITAATISGKMISCHSHGTSSAFAGSAGTGGTISGTLIDCTAIACTYFTFASGDTAGTISGKLIRCVGGTSGSHFASGLSLGGTMSGRIENCSTIDYTGDILYLTPVTGTIIGLRIKQNNVNTPGIILSTGATITRCDIKGNGTGNSIDGSAAGRTAAITFCRTFGKGINGTNVTNLVTTPYNIDSTADIF